MVRQMDVKAAILGLCYDVQQKLNKKCDEEIVLKWFSKKVDQTVRHYEVNKKFRSKEYISLNSHKPKLWKEIKRVKSLDDLDEH